MKILQLVPDMVYGDAIGNDVIAIKKALKLMGHQTEIYSLRIDPRLPDNTAQHFDKMRVSFDDIVIYHFGIGTNLNYEFAKLRCRKILRYHNITPPRFYYKYNYTSAKLCEEGLQALSSISDKVDYCLAVSEFNKNDLIKIGYKQKIDILPILIPFSDYDKPADAETIRKYSDGRINFLFTGRVVPNKKHEDVIKLFYYYKKYINAESRLIFVGAFNEQDPYCQRLKSYVHTLKLSDVEFTGSIKFDKVLAYYKLADLYVCMSEHEGFCVPLVEAMYFGKPILAYGAAAVPETLGNGGLIMKKKDPVMGAFLADRILNDESIYSQIIDSQQKRLNDFSYKNVSSLFKKYIGEFIDQQQ